MPTADDLSANCVSWILDPNRTALLIHDMQQYFLDFFNTFASPVKELLHNIYSIRQHCKALGIPVIYTAQPSCQTSEQRGLLQDMWGPGLSKHPHKDRIVDYLSPSCEDIILTKWRYSAFQKTNLLDILHQNNRNQLIICGVYAHIGCLLTACEAFMHDIQPFFIADAVADFSWEDHKMSFTYVSRKCGVTTLTKDLLPNLIGHRIATEEFSR
jgi:bifunctional isochorismate lyase/aryl carrier protein